MSSKSAHPFETVPRNLRAEGAVPAARKIGGTSLARVLSRNHDLGQMWRSSSKPTVKMLRPYEVRESGQVSGGAMWSLWFGLEGINVGAALGKVEVHQPFAGNSVPL